MTRIFVGNLAYTVREEDVRTMFEKFGRVASVTLPTDPGSGRARGIGFVAMPRLDEADEAIVRLNGSTLGGRKLVVNVARERDAPNSPQGGRPSREANRFHLV